MSDNKDGVCRTCVHNIYANIKPETEWVSCCHPITLKKIPRWEQGDPGFVEHLTGDIRLSEIKDCPTWEPQP